MVQGIKFLSKKGFNPQNLSNQKRVWEAEQRESEERRKNDERRRQLQRERDDEELARSRGEVPKLSFLYDVPPGLPGKQPANNASLYKDDIDDDDGNSIGSHRKSNGTAQRHSGAVGKNTATAIEEESSKSSSICYNKLTESHPDDDEATAAFRKLLAGATTAAAAGTVVESVQEHQEDVSSHFTTREGRGTMVGKFGTVLQGTDYDAFANKNHSTANSTIGKLGNDSSNHDKTPDQAMTTTALEKAVGGRKPSVALTLDEQIQRFPVLANAPRAKGMTATDIGVSFKPLGSQIRNVKCMVCGVWGHSRGDRECRISGWDPFAVATSTTTTTTTGIARSNQKTSAPEADRCWTIYARDEPSIRDRPRDDDDDNSDLDRPSTRKKRARRSSSDSDSGSEDSYRRRRQRHKKKKKKDEKSHHHHKKKSSSK